MPIIDLNSVTKLYTKTAHAVVAVDQLSLQIERGEFIAIKGPSGSGKSTLLGLIGLLDRITDGSYKFDGRDVSGISPDRLADLRNRRLGFVFQSFNLLPRLSALENAELPLVYGNMPRADRRTLAKKILESVGMGDRLDHWPAQLSGGQQQRVALARALICQPDIILADEPTGSLDSKTTKAFLKFFTLLNQKGLTIILVTHDDDVASEAHRVVEIRDGAIYEDRRTPTGSLGRQGGEVIHDGV